MPKLGERHTKETREKLRQSAVRYWRKKRYQDQIKGRTETRTIEYDHRGNRFVVVRYDGWPI